MSIGLFAFTLANGTIKNVLAQDDNVNTALENAIAAVGAFQGVTQVGNRPVDIVISPAVPPFADQTPKALYAVGFQQAGAFSGNVLVLAWPQANGTTTTPAGLLAAQSATANGTPNQASLLATVDMDVTTPNPLATSLSKFAFRSLFTLTELIGIDNYAVSTTLTAAQKAPITTILANFAAAESITLGDPMTIQGIEYLVSVGLLTQARANQVLAAQGYLTVTAPAIAAMHGTAIAAINCTAAGGSTTGYSFTATGLPDGLTISAAGQISGTPTAAGASSYIVTVTDSVGDTATATGTITVA